MDENDYSIEIIGTGYYDVEEIHHNCTVQVLRNTVTGHISIGWWENDKHPEWSEEPEDDTL